MEQQSVRKTYQYKLKPTPEQERALDRTLMLCRHVYNAAVGERREAWRLRGVSVNYYQQQAELPGIKEAMPEYAEVNAQVLQDVVLRVDRAFQAFFQRMRERRTPGYPRFHGRDRYHSFTYPQVGEHGGARLGERTMAFWSSPRSGASPCAGVAHLRAPQDGHDQHGRPMAGMSASPARMCQCNPFPPPDRRRG